MERFYWAEEKNRRKCENTQSLLPHLKYKHPSSNLSSKSFHTRERSG